MADDFNPIGSELPGFDINDLCPVPDPLSVSEQQAYDIITSKDPESSVRFAKFLAAIKATLR